MTPDDDITHTAPVKWEPIRHFDIGGRKYELSTLEIEQQIEIHDLQEKLWPLEAKKLRRVEVLDKELRKLRTERDVFLVEIRELHYKYLKTDCDTCDGDGTVLEARTCDYPSSHDEWISAERMEVVECEDCVGTGKEWMSA